ncbi:MAG: sugar ABC transporter permease [Oscillospiraceae bacterium]|nr:sugar ABC transporter permease [Oscillospiraceae bacterium]
MKKLYSNKLHILIFLLPALILFCGVLIAPIGASAYLSLFDWDGLSEMSFVGLANYKELFTSDTIGFVRALLNSLLLAVLSVFLQLPLALALALALGKKIKGERTFLSVYFMPVLISTVVIGQLFLKIYNPSYGILNVALRAMGLDNLARAWLDKKNALGSAFIPTLWQYVGYHMLLLYAGVKSVPPELREAAMLDGATDSQVNRYIVLPYIKPIIRISVIFAVTGSLKSFDMIYVLFRQSHYIEVPSTLMIEYLFSRNRYGMGSTIAVLMIVLCFGFALLISAIFKEED